MSIGWNDEGRPQTAFARRPSRRYSCVSFCSIWSLAWMERLLISKARCAVMRLTSSSVTLTLEVSTKPWLIVPSPLEPGWLTCGAPDDDLLFYLMARGLPRAQAESLLVQAFLGEAIEAVTHEGAREAMIAEIEAWLARRG